MDTASDHQIASTDPYLAWAEATEFSGHAAGCQRPSQVKVPLLVQLKAGQCVAELAQLKGLRLDSHYLTQSSRFCTVWAHAQARQELASRVEAMVMSLPLQGQTLRPRPKPCAPFLGNESLVIGVIDRHCAVLNSAFRQAWQGKGAQATRVLSLWDQRGGHAKTKDPLWCRPLDFGYGRELTKASIDQLIGELMCPKDELAKYQKLDYLIDDAGQLLDDLHGTQVLDAAAGLGRTVALSGSATPCVSAEQQDAAGRAALVFVELPEPGPDDGSGASADAFILDGIHYILRRAGPDAKVVINLSVGALAGPHDGHSLIEMAIDELLLNKPNLAITVAAGNAALERWHASGVWSSAAGQPQAQAKAQAVPQTLAILSWRTMPKDQTDSFMELWFHTAYPPMLEQLQLRLQAPDGRSIELGLGERRLLQLDQEGAGAAGQIGANTTIQAAVFFDLRPVPATASGEGARNGDARACALLALAPCCGPRAGQSEGVWRVEIKALPTLEGQCWLDAWLQRDTAGGNREVLLQSTIECTGGLMTVDGTAALSSLASGQMTIVVGAARASDGSRSRYSPTSGVSVYGAADESAAVHGLLCCGGLSGTWSRLSGTSVAAPVVARALANLMWRPLSSARSLPGHQNQLAPHNWRTTATKHLGTQFASGSGVVRVILP